MDSEQLHHLKLDAQEAITNCDILVMFRVVEELLESTSDWDAKQEVADMRANYDRMLSYLRDGQDDPNRTELRLQFLTRLVALYWNLLQRCEDDGSCNRDVFDPELTANERFETIMHAPLWSADMLERMLTLLTDEGLPMEERAAWVSAVTLSAVEYFDAQKILLLCYLCRESTLTLRMRAVVGLVIAMISRGESAKFFPEVMQEIVQLCADSAISSELIRVQHALIAAQSTPRANINMLEKLNEIGSRIGRDDDQRVLQATFTAIAGVEEMGADLNLSSFLMLRRALPFFNTRANWFWPFTIHHPELSGEPLPNLIKRLFSLGGHTETDKYGFVLTAQQRHIKFLNEEGEDLPSDAFDNIELPDKEVNDGMRPYIFDLFRYYTAWLHTSGSENPFTEDVIMMHYAAFASLFADDKERLRVARHCLRCEQYRSARDILSDLATRHPDSAKILRMQAECSKWMGEYSEAAELYAAVHHLAPDDTDLEALYANALMLSGREAEALPMLYKLKFNGHSTPSLLRDMAWCLFVENSLEESMNLYMELTTSPEAVSNDWVNMGHIHLQQQDMASAVACYDQAMQMDGITEDVFNYIFEEDADLLFRRGIDSNQMGLVVDALLARTSPANNNQ